MHRARDAPRSAATRHFTMSRAVGLGRRFPHRCIAYVCHHSAFRYRMPRTTCPRFSHTARLRASTDGANVAGQCQHAVPCAAADGRQSFRVGGLVQYPGGHCARRSVSRLAWTSSARGWHAADELRSGSPDGRRLCRSVAPKARVAVMTLTAIILIPDVTPPESYARK